MHRAVSYDCYIHIPYGKVCYNNYTGQCQLLILTPYLHKAKSVMTVTSIVFAQGSQLQLLLILVLPPYLHLYNKVSYDCYLHISIRQSQLPMLPPYLHRAKVSYTRYFHIHIGQSQLQLLPPYLCRAELASSVSPFSQSIGQRTSYRASAARGHSESIGQRTLSQ